MLITPVHLFQISEEPESSIVINFYIGASPVSGNVSYVYTIMAENRSEYKLPVFYGKNGENYHF